MNENEQLLARVKKLEEQLQILTDKVIFNKDIMLQDGRDIIVAKGVGTKIGTESTQKLAFFGATPIARQATISTPSSAGGTYSQSQVQSIVNAVIELNTLVTNFGFTS